MAPRTSASGMWSDAPVFRDARSMRSSMTAKTASSPRSTRPCSTPRLSWSLRMGAGGAWLARVRAGLTALLGFLDSDRAAARLLIVESLAAGPRALERRRQVIARLVAVLELGRTEGSAKLDPPALTAEAIVGGLLSVLHGRLAAAPIPRQARRRAWARRGELSARVGWSLDGHDRPPLSRTRRGAQGDRTTRTHTHRHGTRVGATRLQDLPMRLTYRTMRVLVSVAENPGSSTARSARVPASQTKAKHQSSSPACTSSA